MLKFSLPRLPFREDKLFGILVLILLSVPLIFYWGTYEKYETIKVSLLFLLTGAALLVWRKNPELPSYKKAKVFWILFLGLTSSFVLSLLFTQDWVNSILGSYMRFSNGLLFFLAWASLLVMFMVQAKNTEKRNFFFKIIFFDSVAIALVSVLQSFSIGFYQGLDAPAISRAPGLLGNPNFSTMFLASALSLAVPLFGSAKKISSKLYYAVGTALSLWAIILLSSRGAFLGFGVMLAVSLLLSIRYKFSKKLKWVFVALGVFGAVFWLLFYQLTPRQNLVASTINLKDENINSRLLVWKLAQNAILDKPIFGFGPGNFLLAYEQFRSPELGNQGIFEDPHNLFLQQAVTSGLPFLLLFFGLFGWSIVRGLKAVTVSKDIFFVASIAGLVSLLVMAGFNPFTSPNWLLLVLFAGVLLGGNEPRETEGAILAPGKIKFGLSALGIVMICFAAVFFTGEVLYYQGARAFNAGEYGKAQVLFRWTERVNPYQELSRMYLAASSIRLGSKEGEILNQVEAVTRLHPKRSSSYALKSNLYYYWYYFNRQQEFMDSAVLNLEKAITMDPYFGRRYGRLGYYYLLKNNPQKAEENIKLELGMEPGYLPGWLLLAKAYQVETRPVEVVKCLSKASELRPDLPELKYLLKAAESVKDIRQLIIPGGISPDILE